MTVEQQERIAKLEERTAIMRDDQRQADKRLGTIERDMATMKSDMSAMNVAMKHVAQMSEQTCTEVKKGKSWLVAALITFFLGLVAEIVVRFIP